LEYFGHYAGYRNEEYLLPDVAAVVSFLVGRGAVGLVGGRWEPIDGSVGKYYNMRLISIFTLINTAQIQANSSKQLNINKVIIISGFKSMFTPHGIFQSFSSSQPSPFTPHTPPPPPQTPRFLAGYKRKQLK